MSKVTYKGIELGKSADAYSQVQVAELVALHMKHNCDSQGIYEGTIQTALEKMFSYDWTIWEKKLRSISTLIRYLGYRSSRDGNGRKVWIVPDEELKSGGIRVTKDIPVPPITKENKVAEHKGIPEGLLKNIKERSNTIFTCDQCGKTMKEIARGPHMRMHIKGGLTESATKLLEAVEAFPGQGVQSYEDVLGWTRTKTRMNLKSLRNRKLVESVGRSVSTRYYSLRTDKDKIELAKTETKPPRIKVVKAAKVDSTIKSSAPIDTIKVIKAADGGLYHFDQGKIYRVSLEEISI